MNHVHVAPYIMRETSAGQLRTFISLTRQSKIASSYQVYPHSLKYRTDDDARTPIQEWHRHSSGCSQYDQLQANDQWIVHLLEIIFQKQSHSLSMDEDAEREQNPMVLNKITYPNLAYKSILNPLSKLYLQGVLPKVGYLDSNHYFCHNNLCNGRNKWPIYFLRYINARLGPLRFILLLLPKQPLQHP